MVEGARINFKKFGAELFVKVQESRVGGVQLALDGLGLAVNDALDFSEGDVRGVDALVNKPAFVHATPPGPPGHLIEVARREEFETHSVKF